MQLWVVVVIKFNAIYAVYGLDGHVYSKLLRLGLDVTQMHSKEEAGEQLKGFINNNQHQVEGKRGVDSACCSNPAGNPENWRGDGKQS